MKGEIKMYLGQTRNLQTLELNLPLLKQRKKNIKKHIKANPEDIDLKEKENKINKIILNVKKEILREQINMMQEKKVRFSKQITVFLISREGNSKSKYSKSKTKQSLSAESVVNLIAKRKLKEKQKAEVIETAFLVERQKIISSLPHWVNNGLIENKDKSRYLNIIHDIYNQYENEEAIMIIKELRRQEPRVTLKEETYAHIR